MIQPVCAQWETCRQEHGQTGRLTDRERERQTKTETDRLTFQSMVAKAVMVGCKTSDILSDIDRVDKVYHTGGRYTISSAV